MRAFVLQVNFSSLDIHLHTEALLNTINYLNNVLPQAEGKPTSVYVTETEDKGDVIKKIGIFKIQLLIFLSGR